MIDLIYFYLRERITTQVFQFTWVDMGMYCKWHILWTKLCNKVPDAPYLCTNVVYRMNELVDQRKEGCKDAYSKEKVNNKISKNGLTLKIKFIFPLKLNLNVGQFYKKNIKFWFLQKVGKNHK